MNSKNYSQKPSIDTLQLLKAELGPYEDVVWHGKPVKKIKYYFSKFLLVFSLVWLSFVSFICFSFLVSSNGLSAESVFIGLFFVPFYLVGFRILFLPFRLASKADSVIYAVTNERAIIASFGKRKRIKKITPDSFSEFNRFEDRDGVGAVLFYNRTARDSDGDSRVISDGFKALKNPGEAERYLMELKTSYLQSSNKPAA